MRRQALPLKTAGKVQEGRRSLRVVGENADCQRGSEASVSRSESLAERGAEMSRTQYRDDEGTLETTRGSGQGAALAVGVRPQRGDTTTRDDPTTGVWPIGLFSPAFIGGKLSVGYDLHEEGHINSWLNSRIRCPQN